jgi:tRNA pseudouridine32 synthase/23S rRNA pseudouridine746 synthase
MIVFENENFIAADKPARVLTTPARDASDSRRCLGRDLQMAAGRRIYPVHRLDFEVSGLVLFAKTAEAHRLACGWFERAEVGKFYRALSGPVSRDIGGDWTDWRSRLVRGKRRAFEAAHGKDSLTRARLADSGRGLWELQPVTGRSHQLRFEMAKHGHPILGDTLYGGPPLTDPEHGIALRAIRLDFRAISGERLGLPEVVQVDPAMLSSRTP